MKLKKYISTLLTVLILASSIGVALNVHYCHGSVSSVTLAYRAEKNCQPVKEKKSCCGMAVKTTKKCCKDNVVKLHDKSDNIIVKSLQLDLSTFCFAAEWQPAQFYTVVLPGARQNPSFYCEANAPPLFKLYCQYIFYA